MILNRNPDNFFAKTEQVAFCTAHIIPGIYFSIGPLLPGRIHSYVDTQITRLGGPNFHEIPINSSLSSVQNNQRDSMHRQALHHGRVAYEPNSLAGGCPFQAETGGFVSYPESITGDKVQGKPEKFTEHYAQTTLFYESQTAFEKAHIAAVFRFELSKVGIPAIRERMLASLENVSRELAAEIASRQGIEVPNAMPQAVANPNPPEVNVSPALSLMALLGECGVRTRQIAVLVENGVHHASLVALHAALTEAGAVVHLVGPRVCTFVGTSGEKVEADKSMENSPGFLFDALVMPEGSEAVQALAGNGDSTVKIDRSILLRWNKLRKASSIIEPVSDMTQLVMVKTSLIKTTPSSGPIRNPSSAPTIPTTTLRMMPCWALVPMIMLATQPIIPPMTSHTIIPMIPCLHVIVARLAPKKPILRLILRGHRALSNTGTAASG